MNELSMLAVATQDSAVGLNGFLKQGILKTTRTACAALLFGLALLGGFMVNEARAGTFTVINTLDSTSGSPTSGSLRDAIIAANTGACAAPCLIRFGSAAFSVDQNILLSSPLDPLNASNVTIDGLVGDGGAPTGLANSSGFGAALNGDLNVMVTNAAGGPFAPIPVPAGLIITGSGVTVQGLIISGFFDGIVVSGNGNTIRGNYFGTNAAGTVVPGGSMTGIRISGASNTVGGTANAHRNLISGHGGAGVRIDGGSGNTVLGNYIGVEKTATAALPNFLGVLVTTNAATNLIGTGVIGNVISGNIGVGVVIDTGSTSNSISGNRIGTNGLGTAALANDRGIWILDAPANRVTGSNNIGFNTTEGIDVDGGAGNVISGNSIHDNGTIGIDLDYTNGASLAPAADGVTPNDPTDTDAVGGNNYQNFPTINSASFAGGTLSTTFSLNSSGVPATLGVLVELYKADAAAVRQGLTSLGTQCFAGNTFTNQAMALPTGLIANGDQIVATATSYTNSTCSAAGDGTSEFSAAFVVTAAVVAVAPTITNGPPPAGTVGVAYSFTYTSTGSPTFSVTSGTLPAGLTLTTAGVLSGTPTSSAGSFPITITAGNGTAPAATQAFTLVIAQPAPTVTALSPASGPAFTATVVTITGTGFSTTGGATTVTFGTMPATNVLCSSTTTCTATSPFAGSGTVSVRVTTGGQTSADTVADDFTYIAALFVGAVSPTSGPSAGGTVVTITGGGFSTSGATTATFGTTPATVLCSSTTTCTATSPAGTGTVNVRITTGGQTSAGTSLDLFTYVAGPTVSALSPASGPSAGGTVVTITGGGFSTSGATTVTFGTTPATNVLCSSTTTCTATSPAGTGTASVRLTVGGQTSADTVADDFTYIAAPFVTGLSPTSGPSAGGTVVTITGGGFSTTSGATTVTFGTTVATNVLCSSTTTCTATSPTGTGTVNVRITTGGQTSAGTSLDLFTYVAAPTVTGLSPTSGPSAGGTTVFIVGTNFTTATTISFGGTAVTQGAYVSSTQFSVVSPAGTGVVDVLATTAGVTSVNTAADDFTYIAAPTVTSISPTSGPSTGGTVVTITGSGFSTTAGQTGITFRSPADVTFPATNVSCATTSTCTATSPAGTGVVSVRIIVSGQTSADTVADNFTYVAAPTISALNPTSGPSAGGTVVTITGTGFSTSAGATTVVFGTASATSVSCASTSSCVATSPAGSGTASVRVTAGGQTSADTIADDFTYIDSPTVTAINPSSGPASGNTRVLIGGTGFSTTAGAVTVMFGTTPATSVFCATTSSCQAISPPGTGTVSVRVTVGGQTSADTVADDFTYMSCPVPFNILTPLNGSSDIPVNGFLSWVHEGAATYDVYLGLKGSGCLTPSPRYSGITGTRFNYSGLSAGTEYEYKIRAIKAGCPDVVSSCNRFTTAKAACDLVAATLLEPRSSAEIIDSGTGVTVTFRWSGVPGNFFYNVHTRVGNGPIESEEVPISTYKKVFSRGQLPSVAITWYVEAVGSCVKASEQSTFTIVAPPPPPPCLVAGKPTPELVASAQSNTSYVLGWTAVEGASAYEVQESNPNTAIFATPAKRVSGTAAAFIHSSVGQETKYYYRVRAIASCNNEPGPYSDSALITVGRLAPVTTSVKLSIDLSFYESPEKIDLKAFIVAAIGIANGRLIVLDVKSGKLDVGQHGIDTTVTITSAQPWLSVTPSSVTIPADGSATFTVIVNPEGLPNGTTTGTLTFTTTSGPALSLNVPVSISLITPVSPIAKGVSPANAFILPAVAHIDGIHSSWQSDVRVTNTASRKLSYHLTYTPSGTDGTVTGLRTTIEVEAGQTIAMDDIVDRWFGLRTIAEGANGTLEIRPVDFAGKQSFANQFNFATIASSRSYNVSEAGTVGQFVPAVPFAGFAGKASAQSSGILSMQQIAQSSKFRTNLGIVEGSGKPADVQVTVFDASGKKLTEFVQKLKAAEHQQLNSVLATKGITLEDGRIELKVISDTGKITGYASVIDAITSDPSLVPAVELSRVIASRFIVPGVADYTTERASWRTDMRLFNSSPNPVNATLTFYPENKPQESKSVSLSIAPGEVKVLDGILRNLFKLRDVGGAVHVNTTSNVSLIVTARTYDQRPEGTVGQFIQAVTVAASIGLGDKAQEIQQLEESVRYRTNLGLAEVSGKSATVEVTAIVPDSTIPIRRIYQLAPNQFTQITQIFKQLNLPIAYNARLSLRVISGEGKITGYGSMIDNKTQDPTYVPAQ